MAKRYALLLPIIALMIPFVVRGATPNLPTLCKAVNWRACPNGDYYCSTIRGDSCKNPTYSAPRVMENWSQKQKTATQVKPGVTVKSTTAVRYVAKYVIKRVCTVKRGKRTCSYQRVRIWVAVRK